MSHLTLVMFGKVLILAICGAIGDAWIAFRKRRAERGLPLKQNKDGVYVPNDWAAKVEVVARGLWRFQLVVAALSIVITVCLALYFRLIEPIL